jgi:mono/diheme cytochrome c family protein
MVLTWAATAASAGEGAPPPEPDGKAILAAKCGKCHALDASSSSPLAQAPPFRDVFKKFPTEELRIRLSEGVVSHYKTMPMVDFTDEDVTAIITYLSTLYVSP